MDDNNQAALRTAYQEVCKSYHAIADFRAKLLGLLPLASGAGIFLLLESSSDTSGGNFSQEFFLGIGVFGLIVTLGLFVYELRGIQRCNGLIEVGKSLEKALQIDGQFRLRPDPINNLIGTTLAARVIYPAVLASWLFIALQSNPDEEVVRSISIVAFLIFFGGSFALNLKVDLGAIRSKLDVEEEREPT